MKKEKGFTLIELIAVVIILGLIALIAIPYFTGSMKTFRDDFYDNLSRTVETAGKEFFKDNTKYLPSKELYSSKVSLSNLIRQKYINNSDDYEGNECDLDNSYVIVIKKERSSYIYKACILCPGDDYSTFSQTECDGAWGENSHLEVELGTMNPAYIYKGTSREEAYEKLKTTVDVVKKNYQGEVIGRVSGEETGAEELYPINIDVLDTNTVGTYSLKYEFQGTTKDRTVYVYENGVPGVAIKKQNTMKSGNVNNNATSFDDGPYTSTNTDIWGQKLHFDFTKGSIADNTVKVQEYQWLINNRWETFCTVTDSNKATGICDVDVSDEMVKDVKFRYIDSNGNISKVTGAYNIRIDNTKPSCSLSYVKPDGNNDWYVKDYNITANNFTDASTTSVYGGTVQSGIRRHGVGVGGTSLANTLSSDTKTQTADSPLYKWYGYVEDKAGNWAICESVEMKKDKTKPSCALTSSGTKTNGWYSSGNPKVYFTSHTDATSTVDKYGIGSIDASDTAYQTTDTTGVTFTGYIRDKAGNVNTCTTSLKRDTTNPVVTYTKTATGPGGVTARINCSDVTSGCVKANESHGGLKARSNTYTMTDNAGHSASVTVIVESKPYSYTYCTSVHHYCERKHCNWYAGPPSGCNYWYETYDCYERDCHTATGTTYY